ncbi:NADH-cytochrome b5 reductase [Steccherinum ochraceum]|uniref:NADH-cytochrome b5 reductase n=1 Tax=Steccherinum ochraceum TaxID=92696 RepID=A0A4R0R7V8_9APHY|nr:NADH-cytochrome b5 reductase [Steccherinum ochraceum]
MSFLRTSLRAQTLANVRRYSTAPEAKKSSNLPFYLGGAGLVGLATYIYLDSSDKKAAPVVPKRVQEKSPLDPQNFVDFKLKRVEPYNHNSATYVFELPNNDASLLPVASCVVVKSSTEGGVVDAKGKPVIRPYTPVSSSDQEGELAFLIKRYEGGKMSQHIHGLKPGDALSIKGPIPKFPIKENQFDEVGMIAGGSGITPMYQILTHVLSKPENKTKFTLIFANVTPSDILLREEFDKLQKAHPDTLNIVYTVDKPEGDWKGTVGYVNAELLKKHVAPASLGEKVKVFVCGPPGQVAAVAGKKEGMKQGALGGVLKELGYTEDQVFKF